MFKPGEEPDDAIFCDIPRVLEANDDGCATPTEAADPDNISLAQAATALVTDRVKMFALDFSDDAKKQCGGLPKKIKYFGGFPDGLRVCINCGTQMPDPYPTLAKACAAKCQDLVNQDGIIPAEGTAAYCEANAKVATNHDDKCYEGACTLGGNPNLNWGDPRKSPEPVQWTELAGTTDYGGTSSLEKTFQTTGSGTIDFNGGAASAQLVTTGDAWVEFSAKTADKAHVLGVRENRDASDGPCINLVVCPDKTPSLGDFGFAISLNTDGFVYVLEVINGVLQAQGPFFQYTPGERYRVHVTDRHDGTARITYSRIAGGVDTQFAETTLDYPRYPLRVNASFREQDAVIENATIVRIK